MVYQLQLLNTASTHRNIPISFYLNYTNNFKNFALYQPRTNILPPKFLFSSQVQSKDVSIFVIRSIKTNAGLSKVFKVGAYNDLK